MMSKMRSFAPLSLCLILAACGGEFKNPFDQSETPEPIIVEDAPLDATDGAIEAPSTDAATIEVGTTGGTDAAALDTATEAEKEAVTNVPAPVSGFLGETVAALGDPTKPGFWLKTPLVTEEQEGRIERVGGAVAQVTLIPLEGGAGGSQISLSAMRALDIGLTDLATLKVYSN